MGIRTLAEGHIKLSILTTKPANPGAPTAAELTAGIDASCKVTKDGFRWTLADSDTVDDAALCVSGKAVAPGGDNYDLAIQIYRYWLEAGGGDPDDDDLYAAMKTKGTTLWGYARITDKLGTEPWAANDEIHLGVEFWTDWPQHVDGGWIKLKVPVLPTQGWPHIKVAAGA